MKWQHEVKVSGARNLEGQMSGVASTLDSGPQLAKLFVAAGRWTQHLFTGEEASTL